MRPDKSLVNSLPEIDALIQPTLEALRELGGTARKADISDRVSAKMNLSPEQLALKTPSGAAHFSLRMDSVRLRLLSEALISQPKRGTWQLTEDDRSPESVAATVARRIEFHEFFDPTIQAIRNLGGSATNQEIHDEVVKLMRLSDEVVAELHKPGATNRTRIAYRLGWVRSWLKKYGLVENSTRGVWSLTAEGQAAGKIDGKEVERTVYEMMKNEKDEHVEDSEGDISWRESLLTILTSMHPIAFERLCQRLLRESGFTSVEVTQPSHDGGIDGKGILQVNAFLSFRVEFQCKRFSGSVGPDVVQKLRGAMSGSADRGLIVTTGNFTQGAKKEATREDKAPIELVDGEQLIDKLAELELGVTRKMVPAHTVSADFFSNI